MSKAIRDNDIVARLGGDEFSILLPSIGSKENAIAITKDILKVMQEKWHLNDNVLKVTTSMGIAMAPSEGATRHTVMKNADLALYEAKNAGRNSFKFKDFQPKELTTGS